MKHFCDGHKPEEGQESRKRPKAGHRGVKRSYHGNLPLRIFRSQIKTEEQLGPILQNILSTK
jgi:hypothetical protein